MATIAHQLLIDSTKEKVYDGVTTTKGLSKWWHPDCTAKAEVGFVNIFRVDGQLHNKMLIVNLQPNQYVEWECVNDNGAWTGTYLSFEIIEKNGVVILNFKHGNWPEQTEFFTICNFHWARHLLMLKALCETGENQVIPQEEAKWLELFNSLSPPALGAQ
jgi:uncharacterized protein YndB with AHSA1/START domain